MEKPKTTAPDAKSYLEKKYEFNLVKRFAKRKNTMKAIRRYMCNEIEYEMIFEMLQKAKQKEQQKKVEKPIEVLVR